MFVKKNDTVLVIAGADKGKTGKVVSADPKSQRVRVEGVNIQKKHKKPRSANDVGGIVDQIGAIDVSNVQVICSKCNKATRVSHEVIEGKKIRVCKKCGASLEIAKEVPQEKKATRKRTTKVKESSETATAEKKTTRKKSAKAE